MSVVLICTKHPQYRAIGRPKGCKACGLIYDAVRNVEEANRQFTGMNHHSAVAINKQTSKSLGWKS